MLVFLRNIYLMIGGGEGVGVPILPKGVIKIVFSALESLLFRQRVTLWILWCTTRRSRRSRRSMIRKIFLTKLRYLYPFLYIFLIWVIAFILMVALMCCLLDFGVDTCQCYFFLFFKSLNHLSRLFTLQDSTCHLVDKSVTNQTNSLVAEPGTNSYLLKELRYWSAILKLCFFTTSWNFCWMKMKRFILKKSLAPGLCLNVRILDQFWKE